ncbi:hypothetical protein C7M84_008421 [Penaeus vannamei]|uniref:Uncharacterized protein n=1 Tax=Penaeus vannamei TaxID=6689 RepID=A0A3R7Q487_PENVA|nr:hypothetical protein C7M84_008421 [Penaeus vannamei]
MRGRPGEVLSFQCPTFSPPPSPLNFNSLYRARFPFLSSPLLLSPPFSFALSSPLPSPFLFFFLPPLSFLSFLPSFISLSLFSLSLPSLFLTPSSLFSLSLSRPHSHFSLTSLSLTFPLTVLSLYPQPLTPSPPYFFILSPFLFTSLHLNHSDLSASKLLPLLFSHHPPSPSLFLTSPLTPSPPSVSPNLPYSPSHYHPPPYLPSTSALSLSPLPINLLSPFLPTVPFKAFSSRSPPSPLSPLSSPPLSLASFCGLTIPFQTPHNPNLSHSFPLTLSPSLPPLALSHLVSFCPLSPLSLLSLLLLLSRSPSLSSLPLPSLPSFPSPLSPFLLPSPSPSLPLSPSPLFSSLISLSPLFNNPLSLSLPLSLTPSRLTTPSLLLSHYSPCSTIPFPSPSSLFGPSRTLSLSPLPGSPSLSRSLASPPFPSPHPLLLSFFSSSASQLSLSPRPSSSLSPFPHPLRLSRSQLPFLHPRYSIPLPLAALSLVLSSPHLASLSFSLLSPSFFLHSLPFLSHSHIYSLYLSTLPPHTLPTTPAKRAINRKT